MIRSSKVSNNKVLVETYLLFKRDATSNSIKARNASPVGRFRAVGVVDDRYYQSVDNSMSKSTRHTQSIKTNALFDFNEGDWVLDVLNNELWKIQEISSVAEVDCQKQKGTRVSREIVLSLIR